MGFAEAGSFVQSRITGAFDGIRERLPDLPADRFIHIEGRGMRQPSQRRDGRFSPRHARRANASSSPQPPTPARSASSTPPVKPAAKQDFAIVGQDCIPEAIDEMRTGKSALIGSISHEVETYGPRLIQLGIALLRGYTVPPYNYVRHQAVTAESLVAGTNDDTTT